MDRSEHSDGLSRSYKGVHTGSEYSDSARSFPIRFRPQSEDVSADGFLMRSVDPSSVPVASYPRHRSRGHDERSWNQSRPVSAHPRSHRSADSQDHWGRQHAAAAAAYPERGDDRPHVDPTHRHATQVRYGEFSDRFLTLFFLTLSSSTIFITWFFYIYFYYSIPPPIIVTCDRGHSHRPLSRFVCNTQCIHIPLITTHQLKGISFLMA